MGEEDFYQRKIMRLEDDICIVHDELARIKTKLRVAEDFKIKYEILLKTSEEEIIELKQVNQDREEKGQQEEAEEGQNTEDLNQGSIEQDESKWKKREYELEQKLLKEADK